ncbi:hypothetical protein VOLCADRAFT_87017 [Volvox carteri f. nagariensis]|uniref:Pherophorin domain-containing protein n=1 Tax=Volvox carteri f. nagariensis TaxID=3068 RepID=D8TJY6_VOLCA|nr:uncharacterized protein VOLCADRAFT_87017 [Volvox carteri f. nagariensis]EFJ51970.1 hypothetical protein VOLCADRAFT_87017 [Volvox carteri f. nagariensis]|eukprot:XP_002946744.1 hypothetical protein VOLCADRAFT_87017 [Volvox carteri f. nagariensis]
MQDLSGRFGTIYLRSGDSCIHHIMLSGNMSSLELRSQGLTNGSHARAIYCPAPDCVASKGTGLRDDTPALLEPADYPNGIWINVSVPTIGAGGSGIAAAVEFNSALASCSELGTILLPLFLTPPDDARHSSRPSYSLCVPAPNNHPDFGLSFSWSWSMADLPRVFEDGFYAVLKPFPLTLPLGVYDINLLKAVAPRGAMEITLDLLAGNGTVLASFDDTTTGFYIPAANDITQASLQFYLPAGIGSQSTAVYTVRHMPSAPPLPPAPMEQNCTPASSPYIVQRRGRSTFVTLRMPYTKYVDALLRTNVGDVDNPSVLTGGCAFSFPATTTAGDSILRHILSFTSAPSADAAALAWLSSSPASSKVRMRPGTTVSLPAPSPADSLTVLLSGPGSISQPLVLDYMAELASCAAPNTVPLHLTALGPQTAGNKMTLSVCNAAPNVISNDTRTTTTMLDVSIGWNTSRLPAVFSDQASVLAAEMRNSSFGQGKRLPSGWYRVALLHHPSIVLRLTIGNTTTSANSTIFLPDVVTNLSLYATVPLSPTTRAMSAAVRLAPLPFPPPQPNSPPSPRPPSPAPSPSQPPSSPAPPNPVPPSPATPSPAPPKPLPPIPPLPSPLPPSPPSPSPFPPSAPSPPAPSPSPPNPLAPSLPPPTYPLAPLLPTSPLGPDLSPPPEPAPSTQPYGMPPPPSSSSSPPTSYGYPSDRSSPTSSPAGPPPLGQGATAPPSPRSTPPSGFSSSQLHSPPPSSGTPRSPNRTAPLDVSTLAGSGSRAGGRACMAVSAALGIAVALLVLESGSYGSITLRPGDDCVYHISPHGDISNMVIYTGDLGTSQDARVWYCPSPDCGASGSHNLTAGVSTPLLVSNYPDGIWIHVSVPSTGGSSAATLELSAIAASCSAPHQTPLLLYRTVDGRTSEPWPSYSLCVTKPNNNPDFGIAFSWEWSFGSLPYSFGRGFHALLPPFDLTLPHGVYDIQLMRAYSPDAEARMGVSFVLLSSSGVELVRFNESVSGYFVPAVNNITRGSMEFYLPAGIADQSAAVATPRTARPFPTATFAIAASFSPASIAPAAINTAVALPDTCVVVAIVADPAAVTILATATVTASFPVASTVPVPAAAAAAFVATTTAGEPAAIPAADTDLPTDAFITAILATIPTAAAGYLAATLPRETRPDPLTAAPSSPAQPDLPRI